MITRESTLEALAEKPEVAKALVVSFGAKQLDMVVKYVNNQRQHHRVFDGGRAIFFL